MVAGKVGNYRPVEDEFDLWVAWISECLCLVYFQHYFLMLPHCHLGIDVRQTAHRLEPPWLSSAEICSSTLYENTQMVVNKLSIQLMISNAAEYS